jgi:hypothetical protein
MSFQQMAKLVEQLGVPLLTAGVLGYALWFLLRWLLKTFKSDFENRVTDLQRELEEQLREARHQIDETKTILIRLVDRIRILDQNLIEHSTMCRTHYGLEPAPRRLTRADRRAELQEELRAVAKNGDE